MRYGDALRGYAHPTHQRDGFRCRSCGLDGTRWPNWLFLTWDHLLPPGHPGRDDPAYVVCACSVCNVAENRTAWDVAGKTPEELVAQKRPVVPAVREAYRRFWEEEVRPFGAGEHRGDGAKDGPHGTGGA